MRKITILFAFLLLLIPKEGKSQITFEANEAYGQLYDLVFDVSEENILYARTVGNHIVKSEDDGLTWYILYSDPLEEFSVLKNLQLINSGENLSFIVSAEGTAYSKVIILDRNNGSVLKSYSVPNPQEQDILIASYDIYENDNDVAIIHTTYSSGYNFTNEVFLTTDGGVLWQSIYHSPDYHDVSVNNVAISPENPNLIFLMRGMSPGSEMGGLYVSQDSGSNWVEKIPGNTYNSIAFNPENASDILLGTFYGYGDHQENLYRSTDGGNTWNIIPINYTTMSSDHINQIKFNPQDTDNIVVLEENEIIITHDNGATWQNEIYTEIDTENYYYGLTIDFNPFTSGNVIIGTDFYSFKSDDGGITLEKFNNKFVNSTGRIDSYYGETGKHLYYGLRNGFIHRDINNDTESEYHLRTLNNPFGSTFFPFADKEVEGRIFNSSRYGMNSILEMSIDHGENFEPIYSSSAFLNIYAMATAPGNSNIVWFSFGDSVYKIDLSNPTNVLVEEITLPVSGLVYGVVIDPINSENVSISIGGELYKTEDGGNTWQNNSSGLELLEPSDELILDAEINPFNSNQYLLATTKGIFISTNRGDSWNQVFDEFVEKIYFSPVTDGHIVAINHHSDGYLFPQSPTRIVYSTDMGENWEIILGETLEYLLSGSSTVIFSEDSADVYFGTLDTGLVRYNIDLFTVGISDNISNTHEIKMYPNPSTSVIKITAQNVKIKRVLIYAIDGQVLLQAQDGWENIDVSSLSSGVHLVKIETNKDIYFKRLIKQ